jgi:hypothetical protein
VATRPPVPRSGADVTVVAAFFSALLFGAGLTWGAVEALEGLGGCPHGVALLGGVLSYQGARSFARFISRRMMA